MFFVNSSKKLTCVTTTIIQNTELLHLLNGKYKTTEIPICPTQAILANENTIDDARCIGCGICKKLIPGIIEYHLDEKDGVKFLDYCISKKMFIYKWLCLSSNYLSGIEIFINGFSRNKRVPFVSVNEEAISFAKCASNVRELTKVQAELKDIVHLSRDTVDLSRIESSIVIIKEPSNQNERDYLKNLHGDKISELAKLYHDFISTLL